MFLLFFISLLFGLLILIGGLKMLNNPLNTDLLSAKLVNVKLGGINHEDYPDYADLYLEYAELESTGRVLTDDELDYIQSNTDITKYLY
jgi:hypothetical protein